LNQLPYEPTDISKVEHRANLLFLLQTFARVAEAKNRDSKLLSSISDKQIAEYKRDDRSQV